MPNADHIRKPSEKRIEQPESELRKPTAAHITLTAYAGHETIEETPTGIRAAVIMRRYIVTPKATVYPRLSSVLRWS